MDLRSRTIPDQTTVNQEPREDSNGNREMEETETQGSTVLLENEDLDLTIPFDMEETGRFHGLSSGLPRPMSPVGARDRETSPMFRWPMPSRVRDEPVCDFDEPMRAFMDEEHRRLGKHSSGPRRENATEETLPMERQGEQRQYVNPVRRGEQERTVRFDSGAGAVGGSAVRDPQPRVSHAQSRARDYDVGVRGNRPQHFNYDRLLPPG